MIIHTGEIIGYQEPDEKVQHIQWTIWLAIRVKELQRRLMKSKASYYL